MFVFVLLFREETDRQTQREKMKERGGRETEKGSERVCMGERDKVREGGRERVKDRQTETEIERQNGGCCAWEWKYWGGGGGREWMRQSERGERKSERETDRQRQKGKMGDVVRGSGNGEGGTPIKEEKGGRIKMKRMNKTKRNRHGNVCMNVCMCAYLCARVCVWVRCVCACVHSTHVFAWQWSVHTWQLHQS